MLKQKSVYSEYESELVDWYLFFDLLQVSKDIINLTSETSIIILVGDTPSYLAPFLQCNRKVFHFAFSNKPFGCFLPPYAISTDFVELTRDNQDEQRINVFVPKQYMLEKYFNYLNNETELTKKFVQDNWNNIVLIDSSSGMSIHGVSIFFNRYVENIINDGEINCANIKGSQPLKFIQVTLNKNPSLNLMPNIAEKHIPVETSYYFYNFRPDLIIYLGSAVFLYREKFMITDSYPRLVPFYGINRWDTAPDKVKNTNFNLALENIKTLKMLDKIYKYLKNNKSEKSEIADILNEIQNVEPLFEGKEIVELEKFLDDINMGILYEKYKFYFK